MTQVAVEALETRSLSSSGGRLNGSRSFYVYEDDPATPILQPASIKLGTGSLPAFGDVFPGETAVFATTFSIEAVPNSNYVWRVTWQYQSGGGGEILDPIEVQPVVPGYVTISLDIGGEFIDAWRTFPGITYWSTAYSGQDIGGVKIDAAGEPTSVFVTQQTLIIEETVSAATMASRAARISRFTGRRNNYYFFGFSANELLYEGASARRMSLTAYSITHRFRYDEWNHARQRPRMNQQRQPDVDIISGNLCASRVEWVQPFPKLGSFNDISENF